MVDVRGNLLSEFALAKVKSIPEPSVMKFTVDIIVKYHHVIDNHYQVFDQEYLMKSQ